MGETAGHAVMTDDQKFDMMNGKGDSLLYRLERERTQNRRHKETLGKNSLQSTPEERAQTDTNMEYVGPFRETNDR